MRRGLAGALLLALAGGVLLLAAGGATWTTAVVEGRAPLPDVAVDVQGADLVPGLRALGLLGLAGVPALLAVRGWGRVALGVLLAAGGVLAVVLVAGVLTAFGPAVAGSGPLDEAPGDALSTAGAPGAWAYGALLGGLLLALAGLLAAVRGRSWPALGARYDAPRPVTAPAAPTAPTGDKQVWEALDRGEDPTR